MHYKAASLLHVVTFWLLKSQTPVSPLHCMLWLTILSSEIKEAADWSIPFSKVASEQV